MNRFFPVASALSFAVAALGLSACDAPIEATTSVRNSLVNDSDETAEPVPISIDSLEVRFLGEEEEDIDIAVPSGGFRSLGAIAPPTIGDACTESAQCAGTNECVNGFCVVAVDTSISELDCGIYEVILRNENGECSFLFNEDGMADRYRGEALYVCFIEARWDIDTHISVDNCEDLF